MFFLKRFYLFIFGERGSGREEKHQCVRESSMIASCTPPTRGLASNPGRCRNRESNWGHFGLHNDAQPTEPLQSGCIWKFLSVTLSPEWLS